MTHRGSLVKLSPSSRILPSLFRLEQALALPGGGLCWKGPKLPAGPEERVLGGQERPATCLGRAGLRGTGVGPALLSIPSSWSPWAGTAAVRTSLWVRCGVPTNGLVCQGPLCPHHGGGRLLRSRSVWWKGLRTSASTKLSQRPSLSRGGTCSRSQSRALYSPGGRGSTGSHFHTSPPSPKP